MTTRKNNYCASADCLEYMETCKKIYRKGGGFSEARIEDICCKDAIKSKCDLYSEGTCNFSVSANSCGAFVDMCNKICRHNHGRGTDIGCGCDGGPMASGCDIACRLSPEIALIDMDCICAGAIAEGSELKQ